MRKNAVVRTAIIRIDNCLDCPHSKKVFDPGPVDSFDAVDPSLCCTAEPYVGASWKNGRLYPGRIIVACEMSSTMREAAAVRDFFLRWLLEAYRTLHRTGHEDGMTDAELSEALVSVFANCGCDAGTDETQAREAERILALPRRYAPP